MVNGWKVTAIIFISLFVLLTAFNLWSVALVLGEEEQINDCYYDVCGDYPQAYLDGDYCSCYNVDEYGYEVFVKTTKMD